ncbi:MAG: hypothetical protein EOM37_14205 [Proteobacteria bacterium]|nr:hypothetical protein [Pseudomonadota bacterium]
MSSFKGKIAVAAKRERQDNFDAWLNRNVTFRRKIPINDELRPAVEHLYSLLGFTGYKKDQKLDDLHILIENLLANRTKRPVAIPMSPNQWSALAPRYAPFATRNTIQLINVMQEKGMLGVAKGYQGSKCNRLTRIWPTDYLLEYFPKTERQYSSKYRLGELVELKDDEGNLIDYKDNERTIRIRNILKKANEVSAKHDILCRDYRVSAFLYAIFKNKITCYGRLHTRGNRHYQGFSGNERQEFTINGQRVVELDFSGLQPRLLYALEGIQFNDDPYSIVCSSQKARPFLKNILLSLLNARSFQKGEAAANKWLREHTAERQALSEIGISKARPLMDAFYEAHKPIAHHFCNADTTGLKLMSLDAKIALDIVHYFSKRNIAILAIHDSFIVQEQYGKELEGVMEAVYAKHTKGFEPVIK